jgi:hypothetical protein
MAPMRFVFALSCLLSFLWGCQSTSESFVYVPPERPSVTYRAPNQSSDELRPSTNFHNNGDSERFPERAYFGIQAADCIGPKGSRGVYIIKLSPDSVLRKIGMGTGDLCNTTANTEHSSTYRVSTRWQTNRGCRCASSMDSKADREAENR